MTFEEAHGGQNLPYLAGTAVQEMWAAANMAFSLCPMLTQGAVEALSAYGSDDLKDRDLEKIATPSRQTVTLL